MASDRDTLAELIHAAICEDSWERECLEWGGKCIRAAEEQLCAGVRPPARRIETPADLNAVLRGTVVRSAAGSIACRFDAVYGVKFGDDRPFQWDALRLPAVVLWEPEQEGGR